LQGYGAAAGRDTGRYSLFPTGKTVGCVISVMNECQSLGRQLDELEKLPFEEVIVVVNGSSDDSYDIARRHPVRADVVHFEEPLGYDVGRAVGARLSRSDVVLFLDGDMCIPAPQLLPFIEAAARGADVVLNPVSRLLPAFSQRDAVSCFKQFLNVCLERSDLEADSLTAVPHALSRRAIRTIGASALAVPPLAQARAIRCGLKIVSSPRVVNVLKANRIRTCNVGSGNPVERLIIGDHLEALHEMMEKYGPRLGFADFGRKRHVLGRPVRTGAQEASSG
jgi:hypothetical protein